jgi:MATE family multidrug resistance protein
MSDVPPTPPPDSGTAPAAGTFPTASTAASAPPGVARGLLTLAWPILVSQLAQTANGVVDTVMAGQASGVDLAAVALGTSIWLPLFLAVLGLLSALQPMVSHLHGAGRMPEIGAVTRQALLLALPLGLLGAWLLREAAPFLHAFGVEEAVIPLTQAYLDGVSWGFPALCVFLALRFYAEGLGTTRPIMIASLGGLAVNVVADYVLVFGKFGFPAMGGPGCGYATGFVLWLMLGMLAWQCRRIDREHGTQVVKGAWAPDASQYRALLRLGLPIGFMTFVETSVFALIGLLIAGIGTAGVAAHQIAMNISTLAFMVPFSLAMAMSIRVGFSIGAGDPAGLRATLRTGYLLMGAVACINAGVVVLGSSLIASGYTQDAEVRLAAVTLLLIVGAFQIPDAFQTLANIVLRGMKDARVPMLVLMMAHWVVGLGSGCVLGYGWLGVAPMGAAGFWTGIALGLTFAGLLLTARLWHKVNHTCERLAAPQP